MSKTLPIAITVLVVLGLLGGGLFWFLKSSTKAPETETQEESLRDLSVEERPYASLTPSADGHNFHLLVKNIPTGATTVDYELVYTVASGVTQGVPGSIKLQGTKSLERDLLLGTCSSGKCRYDEGVDRGTFTIKLRDSGGKLFAKMDTQFRLQKGSKELTSGDGKFSFGVTKVKPSSFTLVMGTFGLPSSAPAKVASGPYGVFSPDISLMGTASLSGNAYVWTGNKWEQVSSGKTAPAGVFVTTQ